MFIIHSKLRVSQTSGRDILINVNELIMSKISRLTQITTWQRALNAARRTIGKEPLSKEPSEEWKAKMLLAEHSPIRLVEYDWSWEQIQQWVTAHLVRHHEGCEKFVHSQRSDRRDLGIPRDELPQGALNDMDMTANAQAIINISRKRLCSCASKETRDAWRQVIEEIKKVDPTLASKCVPECLYRGFCPEFMSSCKYSQTLDYQKRLVEYRRTDCNPIWKQLPENSKIEISNFGDLRNFNGKDILKTDLDKEGYLYYNDNGIVLYPHILVYRLFSSEPDDTICGIHSVYHLDSNKINNNIKNLKKKE